MDVGGVHRPRQSAVRDEVGDRAGIGADHGQAVAGRSGRDGGRLLGAAERGEVGVTGGHDLAADLAARVGGRVEVEVGRPRPGPRPRPGRTS